MKTNEDELLKLAGHLFYQISSNEAQIESLRQTLGGVREFEPRRLFDQLDKTNSRKISANDLLSYMKSYFISEITNQISKAIILEYDQDGDSRLSYDEFLNLVLPASSPQMRDYVLYKKKRGMLSASGGDGSGLWNQVAMAALRDQTSFALNQSGSSEQSDKLPHSYLVRILNIEKQLVVSRMKVLDKLTEMEISPEQFFRKIVEIEVQYEIEQYKGNLTD